MDALLKGDSMQRAAIAARTPDLASIGDFEPDGAMLPSRSVTSPPQSKRLADYQARKESGLCVYPKCPEACADDSVLCPGHRDALRKRRSRSAARVTGQLRDAGKCALCRRRSTTYYCPGCSVKRGRIPSTALDNALDNERRPHYRVDPAARGRRAVQRYVGRARRGAPSAAILDAQDLEYAVEELKKAKAAIAYARSAVVLAMPRIQRDGVMAEAMGRLHVARRWVDEILARHKSL